MHSWNISAYQIPTISLTQEISGTVYTVTGSFEGSQNTLPGTGTSWTALGSVSDICGTTAYTVQYAQESGCEIWNVAAAGTQPE